MNIVRTLDSVTLVSKEKAALGKMHMLWSDQERYERHSFGECRGCRKGRSKGKNKWMSLKPKK